MANRTRKNCRNMSQQGRIQCPAKCGSQNWCLDTLQAPNSRSSDDNSANVDIGVHDVVELLRGTGSPLLGSLQQQRLDARPQVLRCARETFIA